MEGHFGCYVIDYKIFWQEDNKLKKYYCYIVFLLRHHRQFMQNIESKLSMYELGNIEKHINQHTHKLQNHLSSPSIRWSEVSFLTSYVMTWRHDVTTSCKYKSDDICKLSHQKTHKTKIYKAFFLLSLWILFFVMSILYKHGIERCCLAQLAEKNHDVRKWRHIVTS